MVADIEATRAELGDTVEALGDKLDVKAQVRHGLDKTRRDITTRAHVVRERGSQALTQAKAAATDEQGNPTKQARVVAFAAAALLAAAAVVTTLRRRR